MDGGNMLKSIELLNDLYKRGQISYGVYKLLFEEFIGDSK